MNNPLRTFTAVTLLTLLTCIHLQAQSDTVHYLYEPLPLKPGENIWNLGMSLSLLPAPIVEQELVAPTIDLQLKHALSPHFAIYGGVSTNYFTNIVGVGLQFNTGDHDFSFGVGDAFVGFAGIINLGGEFVKNTSGALANIPTIRFGHRFDNIALTAIFSMSYVLYADTHVGSLEDKGLELRVNDFNVTFVLEQPFFGNTYIATGIGFTYSRTPYQIWMLYNSFDQYLVVPVTFFSFRL